MYHIFENVPIQVRNDEIKKFDTKQNDTKHYLFEISENYIVTYFSSQIVVNFCTQNDIKPIILYSKGYKTKYFLLKQVQNWDYVM